MIQITNTTFSIFCSNTDEDRILRFAVSELEHYLVLLLKDAYDMEPVQIIIDCRNDCGLRYDGYKIGVEKPVVSIISAGSRGALHGVYEFLHMLGCSFLFPGKEREIIPSLKDMFLKDGWTEREPWLEYRGLCLYNTTKNTLRQTLDTIDWMAKNGYNFLLTSIHRADDTDGEVHAILWDEIGDAALPEVEKRGIVLDMSEHSTDVYFPREKLFEQHPEWFSLLNGQRVPLQICYSNKDAVEAYGDAIVDFVKDKPWFKFFGIWPLDGGGYCECEHCRDKRALLHANESIARKIAKVRPDLTVEHLAYASQSYTRPDSRMEKNMSVLVCSERGTIAYEWACAAQRAGGAFFYDYLTGDHYRSRADVVFNPYYIRETINVMVSYGFRGIVSLYLPVTCWWQSSINYWYMSQLYYNPLADVKELTRRVAQEMFGGEMADKASKLMLDIICILQDTVLWNLKAHTPDWYATHLLHRNAKLDQLHQSRFLQAYEQIISNANVLLTQTTGTAHKNMKLLMEYAKLQMLYYTCVDSFDARWDTYEKAEPYFKELARLEEQSDNPFVSERYARWRITGRDCIFCTKGENAFEANTADTY